MKPLLWSPSALDDFVNCPRSYHGKRVLKKFVQTDTEEMLWGKYVHKAFEDRQGSIIERGLNPEPVPLPKDLAKHEPYMQLLWAKPGNHDVEIKIAFNKKGQPCHWIDNDIWCRGVIDYRKINRDEGLATIVDYKTGKPHQKFNQLYLYAIHTFGMFPFVNLVNCQFYWTRDMTVTKRVIGRDEIPKLWEEFIPILKQYVEAFKTDVWQERKSGLCNGWCPDKECQNWRPRRV